MCSAILRTHIVDSIGLMLHLPRQIIGVYLFHLHARKPDLMVSHGFQTLFQHEEFLMRTIQQNQKQHETITNELMHKLDLVYSGYSADYQMYLNDRQSWLEREAEYLRRWLLLLSASSVIVFAVCCSVLPQRSPVVARARGCSMTCYIEVGCSCLYEHFTFVHLHPSQTTTSFVNVFVYLQLSTPCARDVDHADVM